MNPNPSTRLQRRKPQAIEATLPLLEATLASAASLLIVNEKDPLFENYDNIAVAYPKGKGEIVGVKWASADDLSL